MEFKKTAEAHAISANLVSAVETSRTRTILDEISVKQSSSYIHIGSGSQTPQNILSKRNSVNSEHNSTKHKQPKKILNDDISAVTN